jgi:hypothetical protein
MILSPKVVLLFTLERLDGLLTFYSLSLTEISTDASAALVNFACQRPQKLQRMPYGVDLVP